MANKIKVNEAKKKPFFSVVVPVYNKGPYIACSIKSILGQTFGNFELLIVCDPSTDSSSDEVAKLTDPRIRVFHRNEPGPGGYAARNVGVKNAKAEWIALLDADDKWTPDYLSNMKKLIESNPSINVFTCSRIIKTNGTQRLDRTSQKLVDNEYIFDFKDYLRLAVYHEHPFHPNTVVVRNIPSKQLLSFPEGRTNRSGDLYAWVILAYKAEKFIWSSQVGSYLDKDVVGVAKTSFSNMRLFNEMVQEFEGKVNSKEMKLLKKYANLLLRRSYFEQIFNTKKNNFSLIVSFYWGAGFLNCAKWGIISLLPVNIIHSLRKLKNYIL